MKKFVFLFSIFFFLCTSGRSQSFTWDTLGQNLGTQLALDNQQHVYAYVTHQSGFLQKYDLNGTLIWQQNFPNNMQIRRVICSNDSTFYMTGIFFNGALSILGSTIYGKGSDDIFLARFSGNGSLLWLQAISSKGLDMAGDVSMNGSDIIITGALADTTYISNQVISKFSQTDLMIAKYHKNGTLDTVMFADQNVTCQGYCDTRGLEIKRDQAGDIVVLVEIETAGYFNSSYIQNSFSTYILKYNQNLQLIWGALAETGMYSYAQNLTLGTQDDILFTVHYQSPHGGPSGSIKKYSSQGNNLQTYRQLDKISGLTTDSCFNIYYTGYSSNSNGWTWIENGQLSPSGISNWIRKDSAMIMRAGLDIINLAVNKCFISGYYSDSLFLHQNLIGSSNFHAIIQHTFGLPTNVTPSSQLSGCDNKSVVLTCNTGGAISWYSTLQSNTPLHSGNSFTTPLLSPGNYTFYAEANTCTMTTGRLPVTFTISPSPTITVPNGTICSGQNYVLNPSGGVSYTYPANNPVVLPVSSSSYIITGSNSFGCVDSAVCFITVKPVPSLSITTSQNTICAGQSATIVCTGAQAYIWNNGPNQPQIVVSPAITTGYLVTGYGTNGCSSVAMIIQRVADCTGINDHSASPDLTIFPNPSNGLMTITTTAKGTLRIIDALGSEIQFLMLKEGKQNIDLSPQPKGIYFLKIETEKGLNTKRIVIE